MSENNVNVNVENEESKTPVYSSEFLMNKERFYDFCTVSYNRIKKLHIAFFCLISYLVVSSLVAGYYGLVATSLFLALLVTAMYLGMKRGIKIQYERMVISEGKESTLNYELFEDKIVSHNEALKREYFYHQITNFFETKNFILLHIQHNLHLTIEKSSLDASVDEVKAFLIKKCTNVKKKKFINCINDRKWVLALLIGMIIVSVVGTIAGIVLRVKGIFLI